jgi:thiol:disulfide interchange protein DsbD
VLLAALASEIRALPRSGSWLTWMEKLLGFVLVGLALFYLAPLLPGGLRRLAWLGLLVVAGIYLGFLDTTGSESPRFVRLKRGLGVAALGLALWNVGAAETSPIRWQSFTPQAFAAARTANRPTVVDFTAEWCIPCREMDATTFQDPAIVEEAHTFAMLRADVTVISSEVDDLMRQYGVLGVPTYLFFSPDGAEAERLVGFVPSDEFLRAMQGAASG